MPKPNRIPEPTKPAENRRETATTSAKSGSLETVARRPRRDISTADKLRIVEAAHACRTTGKRGDLGALLRREGIYSSQLSSWESLLGTHGTAGLAAKKPGRKPKLSEAERRIVELEKRNAALEKKLRVANVLIDLQKKAHEVLGLTLPESEDES